MKELRCKKCGHKLAEADIERGIIEIKCPKSNKQCGYGVNRFEVDRAVSWEDVRKEGDPP